MRRRSTLAAAATLLCGCAAGVGGGPAAGPSTYRLVRAEDVVIVTQFRQLGAVAADDRTVYAASPYGLLAWDADFSRWLPPSTQEDGYPVGQVPVALGVDDFAHTLWLATRNGDLYTLPLGIRGGWRTAGIVAGTVQSIVSDDRDVYVSTSAGWYRAPPIGGSAVPVATAQVPAGVRARAASTLERLMRGNPTFAAAAPSATRDASLRQWPITAAAASIDYPGRYWLATWGGGLFGFDDRTLTGTPMPYGLVGRGAGAIAPAGDQVWIGGDGIGGGGVTRTDRGLQRWEWFEPGATRAPATAVHAALAAGNVVWFGAADGVYRFDGSWRRFTDADGLPSPRVTSLARAGGRVWVGTAHGLAVESAGGFTSAGPFGAAVSDVAAADSGVLWVASERGLVALNPASGDPVAPDPNRPPLLAGRVDGVAVGGGSVWAVASDRLFVYDGTAWASGVGVPLPAAIGAAQRLTWGGGAVWVAGSAGAAAWQPATRSWTVLQVGREIPEGPVRQVLPTAEGLWLATPAGAVFIPAR